MATTSDLTSELAKLQSFLDTKLSRVASAETRRKILTAWGETIVTSVRRNFDEGGRFGSGKYGGGSERWPISQRAEVQGGQTLKDTGGLVSRIRATVSDNKLDIGIDGDLYGRIGAMHHFGGVIRAKNAPYLVFKVYGSRQVKNAAKRREAGTTSRRRVKGSQYVRVKEVTIPARPFMVLQDEDIEELRIETTQIIRGIIG